MKSGFSLLEILIVIAIASLLAGLVLPAAQKARQKGVITKTQATVSAVETALTLYETDFGDYPKHSGTFGAVLAALTAESEDPRWKGPYLRFKEKDIRNNELIDPWGQPYYYLYPQDIHPGTPFLLYSTGPDRREKTGDDIGNW